MEKEDQRQIFHILIGVCAIIWLYMFGRKALMIADFTVIIIGLLLINQRIQGKKIGFVRWFEERFERSEAIFPGWGSATYAAGVLIATTMLTNREEIAAVIAILALGDSLSTIIGRRGKMKLPWNEDKTIEGSLAFFIFGSAAAFPFIGIGAFLVGALLTIFESIKTEIDDNILIPLVASVILLVI